MKRPFVFWIRCVPHCVLVVALFLTLLSSRVAVAQAVKAFPTAEGFGASTRGGRGGQVIYVTNLNDSGPGSFRDALNQPFPRIILFKVSGTITLQSDIFLNSSHSFVTIAGQTAPGGGIQIKNRTVHFDSGVHDVIVRHIRFRPGNDTVPTDSSGNPSYGGLGGAVDGLNANGGSFSGFVSDLIFDHVSFEWGVDENLDISYGTSNVTIQWSILAEGALWGHDTAPYTNHSMGFLAARHGVAENPNQMRLSIHHSLFAHNIGRNPRIGIDTAFRTNEMLVDFRNNIIYNWGGAQGPMELEHFEHDQVTPIPLSFGTIMQMNIVNNVFIPGPAGGSAAWPGTIGYVTGPSRIYLAGNSTSNFCPNTCDGSHWPVAFISGQDSQYNSYASRSNYESTSEFSVAAVTTHATGTVKSTVLAGVGATKPARDSVDSRITNEVNTNTGQIGPFNGKVFMSSNDYPTLAQGTAPTDSDGDGIPDSWEASHSLNPNNSSDGAAVASNGYTNVENYLNELAGDPIPGVGQLQVPPHLRIMAVTP